jgi:hypothetical protein
MIILKENHRFLLNSEKFIFENRSANQGDHRQAGAVGC